MLPATIERPLSPAMPALLSVEAIPAEDRYSLVNAGDYVKEFERVLNSHNVTIARRSALEEVCLEVAHWEDRRLRRISGDPYEDIRINARRGVGLVDIMRRVIRHQHRSDFAGLVPHLRLMNASFAQNEGFIAQERLRDKNNKIFELLIALVCMDVGTNVQIDHPERSSNGTNPDVLVTIDGRRWGFACKTLGSRSALTHFDNLAKGLRQINASSAEVGCVVFNLKNLVPHDLIWPVINRAEVETGSEPIFGSWRNDLPARVLLEQGEELRAALEEVNSTEAVRELFAAAHNRCALPAALLFVQSATSFAFQEGPVPTNLNLFTLARFLPDGIPAAYQSALEKLNSALHHRDLGLVNPPHRLNACDG
jgi:hypothetical protein